MENYFEKGPEKIPTKSEVLEIIGRNIELKENFEILREFSDEQGLTLLDLRVEGKEAGETLEFLYTRAGILPNGVPTHETSIEVSYYQDGNIVGGDRVAVYNEAAKEWE